MLTPVELVPEGLLVLDQRRLPRTEEHIVCTDHHQVARCIRDLAVRGAPAIGIAAAYGLYLAARRFAEENPPAVVGAGEDRGVEALLRSVEQAAGELAATRPTAVNLFWAIDRVVGRARAAVPALRSGEAAGSAGEAGSAVASMVEALLAEARAIHREDIEMNRRIGSLGERLVADGARILTHCNAGALATGGYGTALGVIRAARDAGKRVRVLIDETRPLLQGARLTAWEMLREGISADLITDGMAGHFLHQGGVDLVIVGADRICANGDVANKIGTYSLAVLARENGVPFYVAAPWSTVDLSIESGEDVVIEQRDPQEVLGYGDYVWAPDGVRALNPCFDVTPARYISGIITDRGIACPPLGPNLRVLAESEETQHA